MHIRQKGNSIRITFADTTRPQSAQYLRIDQTTCWSTTYNTWGKKAAEPVIHMDGKRFRVLLEEVS